MNDLQLIKKKIHDEKKVRELLEKLGCWHITPEYDDAKSYRAARPDGDHEQAIRVKNSESLSCNVFTRGKHFDIYGLVSFLKFDCQTDDDIQSNLPKAKKWICEQLDYREFLGYTPTEQQEDPNKWLKQLRKKRKQEDNTNYSLHNSVIEDCVLDRYVPLPSKHWIDEGVSYNTQLKFKVGFDIDSERITFPVHNRYGFLIGVKGRYVGSDEKTKKQRKYHYLHPCDKSYELFNMDKAFKHILEKKEVIIVEGAKTVMLLDQYGFPHAVSIEGDMLTPFQIELLKSLGVGTKYIFAWDKGKDTAFIREQMKSMLGRSIWSIYDTQGLLENKMSPTDNGEAIWRELYEECQFQIR